MTPCNPDFAVHLRLAGRSQERHHPVGVSFGKAQTITELLRADSDVPTELIEGDRDQLKLLFGAHDGVFRLEADHPESGRIRAVLADALREKARVWFITQKPDLSLQGRTSQARASFQAHN